MKTLRFLNLKLFILAMAWFAPLPFSYAQAQTEQDITGSWDIWFEVEDGYYQYTLNITNEDCGSGSFSGNVNQSYPISGVVSGSSFYWNDPEIGGYGGQFDGEISTNETMIGNGMWDNNGHGIWYGFWGESSGQTAVPYAGPTFILQPLSVVTNVGASVTFAALATGQPSPSYQWQFNGTNISGATNASYTISPTAITNIGLYQVVASNCPGTNASTTASLSFLNIQCSPVLAVYGPVGMTYDIQAASGLGGGTNWITITNVTLTAQQPFVYYVDYNSFINSQQGFYRAVPQ